MPFDDAIAAVDLGSNSFHLLIARVRNHQIQVVDRLRDMVQLAAGLEEHGLTLEAQRRAIDCLHRFGQRLHTLPPSRIRAVGTNTLRKVRHCEEFILKAEAALGCPIDIISGIEEARLIYQGVAQTSAPFDNQQLVIDIGGGSTELIIGRGLEPLRLESLNLGSLTLTTQAFADQQLTAAAFDAAELAVQQALEPLALAYRDLGWQRALGASGTIRTLAEVALRFDQSAVGLNRRSLQQLRNTMILLGNHDALAAAWQVEPDRARILPGGLALLNGLFTALDLEQLQVADGALREGVVFDLLGRLTHQDARERTVSSLIRRYDIDAQHSARVAATAQRLWEQAAPAWQLHRDDWGDALRWAAQLHEIGLTIAHSRHHEHGAYVLHHADLPGFSKTEQVLIAALVRGQRRKFPRKVWKKLSESLREVAQKLCILLRLALLLHRSRSRQPLPEVQLQVQKQRLVLRFPDGWFSQHPLTQADLVTEADYLAEVGWSLIVV